MPHSPLKDSRLARGPGESLYRSAFDNSFTPAIMWIMGMMCSLGLFWGTLSGQRTTLLGIDLLMLTSGIAFAICVIVVAINYRKWMSSIERLHKGRAGEQAAAAVLAELGKDGYIIVHDVPLNALDPSQPEGPNIDHLLIGPAGVFVVETKYVAKSRGDGKANEVTYDPNADGGKGRLLFNGLPKDRCALEQVRRNCKTVDVFVRSKQPGFAVPVRPIVIVPGWMVRVPSTLDVAVMNPKQVFTFVRSLPVALQKQQIGNLYESLLPALTREDTTADMFDDPSV